MKIDLQEPFRSLWSKGYLVVNPENRRNVILYNSNTDRTTISYARYLMCIKLGYILSNEYEVDHKDNDKTNDDISNLQVVTKEYNRYKEHQRYLEEEQVCYGFHCGWCTIPFILTECQVKMRIAQGVKYAFCSKECSHNFYIHNPQFSNNYVIKFKTPEEIEKIKQLRAEGLTSYQISEITGFSRNTIMKYWK